MSSSIVDTNKVFDEIPHTMKKLARLVVRAFYAIEHTIVVDYLIRNMVMREEELRDITKFDAKMMRMILLTLKSDHFIKERQQVEEKPDGQRPIRHNYYFISYRSMINVVKYKLDHIRKKLNDEEKIQSHRALYKCNKCEKTYSDLDIGLLWNGDSMQCTYCFGDVEEDPSALPDQNTRNMMATFNEQIAPFIGLLVECDDIKLAPHLIEPPPNPITRSDAPMDNQKQSKTGDRSRTGYKEFQLYKNQTNEVQVNIEGHDTLNSNEVARKDVPIWLQQSTVSGMSGQPGTSLPNQAIPDSSAQQPIQGHHSDDIMRTLLAHESSNNLAAATSAETSALLNPAPVQQPPFHSNMGIEMGAPQSSNTIQPQIQGTSQQEEEDSSDEDDEDEEEMGETLTIGGKTVALAEVTPELISQMTPAEKEEYTRLSQAAYAHMYE